MKIRLSIFFIVFSFYAKSQDLLIDSIITKESLTHTLSALSNDSMKGRLTTTPETVKAANFIAARFEAAGLKTMAGNENYFSFYPVKFEGSSSSVDAINVLGAIRGTESPDTSVIFCAHYDHVGVYRQVSTYAKDSVFNGANDNASGVALLIELAKYYSALGANRYTLVFIAFSGEELGLLGSSYIASHIDQSYIHAVINFDMVGRPIDKWTKKCMVIANEPKPLVKQLNAEINSRKDFFITDQYPEEGLFYRSDHYSFQKVKNRIFFTASSPRDMYYHTIHDELKTIDFDFLLTTTKNMANACKIFLK